MTDLVISLFPGVGLLDWAFEAEGFCVVRGPDQILCGDIRRFFPPCDCAGGIIGGPPCPDFSKARRGEPTGYGLEMLGEYVRCVDLVRPDWFVMENVPGVPDVTVSGYTVQRIDVDGREVGLRQLRRRHFQFGRKSGLRGNLLVPRLRIGVTDQKACVASEGNDVTRRRTFPEFCRLMGIEPCDLPIVTRRGKYMLIGNGVPLPMGRLIASAVRSWIDDCVTGQGCSCGCGREVTGRQTFALARCRKVAERRRRAQRDGPSSTLALASTLDPQMSLTFHTCRREVGEIVAGPVEVLS